MRPPKILPPQKIFLCPFLDLYILTLTHKKIQNWSSQITKFITSEKDKLLEIYASHKQVIDKAKIYQKSKPQWLANATLIKNKFDEFNKIRDAFCDDGSSFVKESLDVTLGFSKTFTSKSKPKN